VVVLSTIGSKVPVISIVVDSVVVEVDSIVVDDIVELHEVSHSHEHVQYDSLVIVITSSDIVGKVMLHVVGTVNGGTHLQPQTQF
jgi:hypothetical protein